jgi:hypothetical protein
MSFNILELVASDLGSETLLFVWRVVSIIVYVKI